MFMTFPQPTDGFEWTQAPWGATLRCRPLGDVADHFFTAGNLSLHADDPAWEVVAREIGVARDQLLLITQVHRADVAIARAGRGRPWVRPEADAIISDDPASAIGVRVADCAPILLADVRLRTVAAVHAGWRGTVQRAAPAAVHAMTETWSSRPEDVIAAIGPCLGSCCGEVGPEVVEAFRAAGHADSALERWFQAGPSDRSFLDLARANRDQLVGSGVPVDQVYVSGICTKTHAGVLHSYRAHGKSAGRMAGVIRAFSLEP
jgi:YfiH family protein